MTYFLGIDTSTTGSKALVIGEGGEVIAVVSSSHTLQTPRPLWSEQDPREWWEAVSVSIRSVLQQAGIAGEQIGAVGLTGQMHGLVLLDEVGTVLRPAILWNDQRTQGQCDEIRALSDRTTLSLRRRLCPWRIRRSISNGCNPSAAGHVSPLHKFPVHFP